MYLTKPELSARLKLSIATIDRLMKNGMPFIKLERAVRFDFEKVEGWLIGGADNSDDNIR